MQICICRVRVEYVKLKAICMPKQWKTIASSMLKDSGYPVYGANGIIGYYSEYNHDKETILVTCRGATCGSVNICEPFSYINGNAMALDNLDEKIDIKYLYYYLKKRGFDDVISGSAQPQITRTSIEKIEIPICEISKQKMIVNLFDKIELLINNQKRRLHLLDELVKARFVEMFGNPNYNPKGYKKDIIKDHIDLLSGYPFKSENYVGSGINICGGLVIMPQKIKWEECVHWKSAIGYENYLLNNNDIVMALDRPWISEGFKIAKVDSKHLPALLIQRTVRIRAIDMNQDYLYYCFICGGFNKHCNVTGSLVPHISSKDIKSFEVMLPPLELQNQFASFVQEIDKSRLLSNHSLFLIKSITF